MATAEGVGEPAGGLTTNDLDGLRPIVSAGDYLRILRARVGILLMVAFAIIDATMAVSLLTPARYSTRSMVYFSVPSTDSTSSLNKALAYANSLVRSYADAATTPKVLDPVIADLQLHRTSRELADSVQARAPIGTTIVEVRATDPSPQRAAAIANAVAQQIANSVKELAPVTPSNVQGIRVLTVAQAAVPAGPALPRTGLNLVLALILGPLVGAAFCVWLERGNPRVLNVADVVSLDGPPLMGYLPVGARRRFLLFRRRREETLRRLLVSFAAAFRGLEQSSPLRTMLFVAPTTNWAALQAGAAVGGIMRVAGTRVIVIDADLRRSRAAIKPKGGHAPGLSSVLRGQRAWRDVVYEAENEAAVISSGPAVDDPSVLLESPAMRQLIADLRTEYDRVVFCAAPVLRYGDALGLAREVDGVVLVGDERYPTRLALRSALKALHTVRAPVRGLVLNR